VAAPPPGCSRRRWRAALAAADAALCEATRLVDPAWAAAVREYRDRWRWPADVPHPWVVGAEAVSTARWRELYLVALGQTGDARNGRGDGDARRRQVAPEFAAIANDPLWSWMWRSFEAPQRRGGRR